jgi:hypothetical protein
MFKRRWPHLGTILSDEESTVRYGDKTLYCADGRGEFHIGYEGSLLFSNFLCLTKPTREVAQADKALIIGRVLRALKWDGHDVSVLPVSGHDSHLKNY